MNAIYGNFSHALQSANFATTLRLVDGALALTWQHSGTTAAFLGDFYALRAAETGLEYNEVRHSVGYLVNELLENALKFRAPGDIELTAGLSGARFELIVSNLVTEATAERFAALLAELTSRDPGELLIERLEANAADETSSASGLGLLTLMNDYGARLGWNFDRQGTDGIARLSTYAALDLN